MSAKGTTGYKEATEKFIAATLEIDFPDLHHDFLEFIPKEASTILDIGAGFGRDAAVFAEMGHIVTAIEPLKEFRKAGMDLYHSRNIEWLDDFLPSLTSLGTERHFDFILISGVWHHLNHTEQDEALKRISGLLSPNGIIALSLRNGPAGIGTHVFSTNSSLIEKKAESYGLQAIVKIDKQPSMMQKKENVSWSRLVLKKTAFSL